MIPKLQQIMLKYLKNDLHSCSSLFANMDEEHAMSIWIPLTAFTTATVAITKDLPSPVTSSNNCPLSLLDA